MFKNNILIHRIPRIFKSSIATYFALTIVVAVLSFAITTYSARTEIIANTVTEKAFENNLEDGCFEATFPLSESDKDKIKDANVDIQENFSVTIDLGGSKLRVFKMRPKIDLVSLDKGKNPNSNEIVLEKLYAKAHEINVGSTINIAGKDFTVSGIGSSPDYDKVKENSTDLTSEANQFGTAFVCDEDFENYIAKSPSGQAMKFNYAFKFTGEDNGLFKSILDTFTYDARKTTDSNLATEIDEWYKPFNEAKEDIEALAQASTTIKDGTIELYDGAIYVSDKANKELEYITTHGEAIEKDINGAFYNINLVIEMFDDNFIDSLVEKKIITKERADQLKLIAQKAHAELKNINVIYEDIIDRLRQTTSIALNIIKTQTQGVSTLNDSIKLLDENIQNINSRVHQAIDTYAIVNIPNVETYTMADDNPRIMSSVKTQEMFLKIIPFILVIIFLLMAYILSIFIKDLIDKEKIIIGTMFALGIKKRNIISTYLMLPIVVCLIGSVIGIVLGCSPIGAQASINEVSAMYSFPQISKNITLFVVLEVLFAPVAIVSVVNFIFINNNLSKPCLDLLKNKISFHTFKLPKFVDKLNFNKAFQIGHLIRHKSNALVMFFGLFVCTIFLLMGLNVSALCNNNIEEIKDDVFFNYQYILKHTSKEVPQDTEAFFGVPVHLNKNTSQTVFLLGVDKSDEYKVSKNKNSIIINDDLAKKWGFKKGDTIVATTTNNGYETAFVVEDIVNKFYGFYAFVDADNLRSLVDAESRTYNFYYSQNKLDFNDNSVSLLLDKEQMINTAVEYKNNNYSTIIQFVAIPIIIFILIIYIISTIMIKKCTLPISTMKLFGYTDKEMYKFYLRPNVFMVLIFSVILLPICKTLSETIYQQFTEKLTFNPNYTYEPWVYFCIICFTCLCYLIVEYFVKRKIYAISLNEVIRSRE